MRKNYKRARGKRGKLPYSIPTQDKVQHEVFLEMVVDYLKHPTKHIEDQMKEK